VQQGDVIDMLMTNGNRSSLSSTGFIVVDDKILSEILDKLTTKRVTISLFGARYADECSPAIIWVTEVKQ